jgi:hypothetical protein
MVDHVFKFRRPIMIDLVGVIFSEFLMPTDTAYTSATKHIM